VRSWIVGTPNGRCLPSGLGIHTSTAAPIATGWSEPVPGRDFPAVDQRLSRRTQILEQYSGTRPPLREKADLAGERLWILRDRVAELAGYRSSADDPQGQSEMGNEKRLDRASRIRCRVVRPRRLTQKFRLHASFSPRRTFKPNFAIKPSHVQLFQGLPDY